MGKQETAFVQKLLEKSQEAFLLAIEIYNKPTIKYRVEGFSFFVCNAWELMLKAHIIRRDGLSAIYYKDNLTRTYSLERCIHIVLTNEKDPLRKNLERIIALRNTSTHFITEEYEMVYIPLFQACVFNYVEKMQAYHAIDITALVPYNFLTLTVNMSGLTEEAMRAKYPELIGQRIIRESTEVNATLEDAPQNYAIRVEHRHYITKKRDEATEILYVDRKADTGLNIVKGIKDVNKVYGYTVKKGVDDINRRLVRDGITLLCSGASVAFNKAHFMDMVKYYGVKENERYCYAYMVSSSPQYSYSMHAIDFLYCELKKDPENILDYIRTHMRTKKS